MSQKIQVQPVILCGGTGTRLWPLSRVSFPKQFLVLSGATSLFQQAVERVNGLANSEIALIETFVVTNEEYRFLALDQLREINGVSATLMLEPVGRNTAPALTIAALQATCNGADPVLVVMPADQTIQEFKKFKEVLRRAISVAATGSIVVMGITPSRPETGYGYIRHNDVVGLFGEHAVIQFIEKPNLEMAQQYLADGNYSWNGGIFVLKASIWLKAIKKFRVDIAEDATKAWNDKKTDAPFVRPNKEIYTAISSESIDYAVIENCPGSDISIKMLSLDAGWSDLGAWDAVWQIGKGDANGNVTSGDTLLVDTANSYIYASTRLVSAIGLDNVVIVETSDAVLVADKTQAQGIKKIVHELHLQKRYEKDFHRKVHRPWGWYDTIEEGERFKVKRIQVNPGASISLQMHHHRAEHWIVVRGIAEVTNGNQFLTLRENQSTYIPQGQTHRLSNPGKSPLEIIEIQSGSYLGDDDIVRFEDNYKRV
jgi:mannose-1-phosphate guanylyltransferase/mannose-6-phosphate isomerase